MKINGRRRPTEAERLDHVETLELLAALVVQLPPLPAVRKQFVVFSSCPTHGDRGTRPLPVVERRPAPRLLGFVDDLPPSDAPSDPAS